MVETSSTPPWKYWKKISLGVTLLDVTREKHMDIKMGSTICTGLQGVAAPNTQNTTREMVRYRNKTISSPRLVPIMHL